MNRLTRPQLSALYSDVKEFLDQCLASGGGAISLPSRGQAVNFRQRCYKFRKAWREADPTLSEYDKLTIPAVPDFSNQVLGVPTQVKGAFTPLNITPPIIAEPVVEPFSPEEIAARFKGRTLDQLLAESEDTGAFEEGGKIF